MLFGGDMNNPIPKIRSNKISDTFAKKNNVPSLLSKQHLFVIACNFISTNTLLIMTFNYDISFMLPMFEINYKTLQI